MEAWINDGGGQFSGTATGIFSATPLGSAFAFALFDAVAMEMLICISAIGATDQLYLMQ